MGFHARREEGLGGGMQLCGGCWWPASSWDERLSTVGMQQHRLVALKLKFGCSRRPSTYRVLHKCLFLGVTFFVGLGGHLECCGGLPTFGNAAVGFHGMSCASCPKLSTFEACLSMGPQMATAENMKYLVSVARPSTAPCRQHCCIFSKPHLIVWPKWPRTLRGLTSLRCFIPIMFTDE